jgi:zinc protease
MRRLILLVALASALASPVRAQMFGAETFSLKNGMQVVVIPNHRVPVVSHMIYYKVGSADEVPGKGGLAHMVEHMMFKGTKAVPAGQFSRVVAANGGRENAFTTADYTGFYENVATDKLELVMRLEADRMANLAPRNEDFLPERQVVLEERRMRVENLPRGLLDEQMAASLYLNSEYHHPVIGWHQEIEGYTLDDVVAFYHRWYAPNNAVLLVAGDITVARLRPLAEKYYGKLPARPVPVRRRAAEPPPTAARTVEIRDSEVHQPSWSRLYLAPSYRAGETDHAYPLQVLAEILGGGATSRFYRALVVDQKVAATAWADYDPQSLGPSSFSIAATPRPDVGIDKLQMALVDQVKGLLKDGVTDQEVAQAKERMRQSIAYAKDSYLNGGRVLGAALCSGSSVEEVESWPRRIGQVTTAQVNAAARQVLKDEASVTGLLLPTNPGQSSAEPEAPRGGPLGGGSEREVH